MGTNKLGIRYSVFGIRGIGKRGLVSNFIAFFGATIAIVLILTFFVLGAGLVKKLDNKGADVAVLNESGVEIDNIFNYSDRYVNLSKARFLVAGGEDVDVALGKVGLVDVSVEIDDDVNDERVAA